MITLQQRRSSLFARVVGTAVLSVATVACGSGPGAAVPSPSSVPAAVAPSTSPLPTAPAPSAPSPSAPVVVDTPEPPSPSSAPADPVETPAPALPVIANDSIATVVTDGLRIRSKPGVSDDSRLLEPLLDRGREVLVVDGPVEASGYSWYLVAPLGLRDNHELPVGWVAVADKTGEAWVEARDAECPEMPTTFEQVASFDPLIALACFGDAEIEFTAQAIRPEATCGTEPGWTIQPDWLGSTCRHPEFILASDGNHPDMYTIIEPGTVLDDIDPGVELKDAVDVVVRGHFDHQASESCRVDVYIAESGDPGVTPEEAVVICRSQFVITSMQAAN